MSDPEELPKAPPRKRRKRKKSRRKRRLLAKPKYGDINAPYKYAEAGRMRLRGVPVKEIAAHLGVSLGTAYSYIDRCRQLHMLPKHESDPWHMAEYLRKSRNLRVGSMRNLLEILEPHEFKFLANDVRDDEGLPEAILRCIQFAYDNMAANTDDAAATVPWRTRRRRFTLPLLGLSRFTVDEDDA